MRRRPSLTDTFLPDSTDHGEAGDPPASPNEASTPAAGPRARPPVKWPGGKRGLIPEIRCHVPPSFLGSVPSAGGAYYEPFAGGAALLFFLVHKPSVLGDVNVKLINVYSAIREDPEGVIESLKKHPNTKEHYLHVRARNFNVGSAADRAGEFIYTNRVGFNGLFRENRSGQFNVPYGDNPNATICDADNVRAVSKVLQGVSIQAGDFADTVADAVAGDFVYFDPPYVPTSATSSFTGYVADGFTARDQVRLRDVALELKQRGVSVVLSNSGAPFVRELYSTGFTIHEVQAARAINSKASGRGRVTELLIT